MSAARSRQSSQKSRVRKAAIPVLPLKPGPDTRVLCAGGLDPSGKAGLLVDVATVRQLGAEVWAVATSLTAQSEKTFHSMPVAGSVLSRQIAALLEESRPQAVKLGAVPDSAALRALVRGLGSLRVPWVVDPVVRTSRGGRLSKLRPADYLSLAAPAVVLTPNLAEAQWLLGQRPRPGSSAEAATAGQKLQAYGFGAVVVKGGDQVGAPTEVVCTREGLIFLEASRLPRHPVRHRGTGCRFASAVAVGLARGSSAVDAASTAKALVRIFLRQGH